MKKLILITSCVALLSVTSFAQVDTTKRTQPQQTPQRESNQLRNREDMKGWTQVPHDQVPAEIRTTLAGTQYKGWENGTIYKNQAGDTYAVHVNDGASNSQKVYYFDKNGKVTKKPSKPNN